MKVMTGRKMEWLTVGTERFIVQWETVKTEAEGKDDIDPDADIAVHHLPFPSLRAAAKTAQQIFDTTQLAWGIVTVDRERLEAYENDKRFGHWARIDGSESGHEIIIDSAESYAEWEQAAQGISSNS